jgi:DNA-binding GntR family transcriptional regulator
MFGPGGAVLASRPRFLVLPHKRAVKDGRALERVLRAMRPAVETGNRRRMLELYFEFHRTIVEMSGHKRLAGMWSRLAVQTRLFLSMTDQLRHNLDELLSIHEPLAEAILAGKGEKAYRLASHHSQRDGTCLTASLARTGGEEGT